MPKLSEKLARYHRQILLPGIGDAGQMRLMQSNALLVGCGALGTVIAETLVRAGIGSLTIIDRDVVDITNLQRQVLFYEEDVALGMPKAEAAANRLCRINTKVRINIFVDDFNVSNAERLASNADLILDGLDNFETRYLLNDLAVKLGKPYLYGGAVGTTGMTMPILPHPLKREGPAGRITWDEDQSTPCLRCVFPEAPPPGSSPTCDTVGVLGPVVNIIASIQSAQAIKLLTGNLDAIDMRMLNVDLWANEFKHFDVSNARDGDNCPCCGQGKFEHLAGELGSKTTSLCGRNAIQITPGQGDPVEVDLMAIATKLMTHGKLQANKYLIRFTLKQDSERDEEPIEMTLFPNGRAIIKGTDQPEVAKSIYAKYVGS
ncbi:MAG: ThiF family adenylyltransferase [Planctomycetota bacterium]|nr:ThiF family adenylyltransferase [Planctomycetota bacterium]